MAMNGPAPVKFRDPALVDFGGDAAGRGRRLERLGGVLVDRPLAHAAGPRRLPELWARAAAVFDPEPGRGWVFRGDLPDPWLVRLPAGQATLALEVRPAPSGQTGVFLEQAAQWDWLARSTPLGATMLSLFGHSGGATLALAAAGAEVFHVDASRQAVALARRNAAASGLDHLPVHWVCEDAATFVRRQLRRGRTFSGAVLDPPTWGHGPAGEPFAIDRDLETLVADVARLLAPAAGVPPGPILLTAHAPGWHHRRLCATLDRARRAAGLTTAACTGAPFACVDDAGRTLDLGACARLPAAP